MSGVSRRQRWGRTAGWGWGFVTQTEGGAGLQDGVGGLSHRLKVGQDCRMGLGVEDLSHCPSSEWALPVSSLSVYLTYLFI